MRRLLGTAPGSGNAIHTSPALKLARDQFVAYESAALACVDSNGNPLPDQEEDLYRVLRSGNPPAAKLASETTLSAYTAAASCARRLPAANAELARLKRLAVAGVELQVRRYQLYQRGVSELTEGKSTGRSTLNQGEAYGPRIQLLRKTVVAERAAVYARLGGDAALKARLAPGIRAYAIARTRQ
jgi:hypothetical protein